MPRPLLVVLMLTICQLARAADFSPKPGEQIATSVEVQPTNADASATTVPLLLYTPEDYKADGEAWPLLLFLHGYGECGDGSEKSLQRVAVHGPPKQAAAGKSLPFVLVSPQCPKPGDRQRVRTAWQPDVLLPLLDRIEAEMNVDPARIYLTGLSMGGYGTWRLAAAAPERFAAAVPICGGGEPESMAEPLSRMPVWAFHGGEDPTVPVARSIDMVEAIRAAGGHPRLTIYPTAGHDSWTETYDNPMFYDWLLGERRAEPQP